MIDIDIRKTLGNFTLDVSIFVPSKGISGLVGPSGSGKSTLFSCLTGLTRPDDGVICLDNRTVFHSSAGINIKPANRNIGVVFQEGLLFPHMNVRKNLLYGAPNGRATELFDRIVSVLGLAKLLNRKPPSLSGGERQRVAIGRALLSEPNFLLLDEPLSALDPERKEEVMTFLEALKEATATPMIYISHAPEEIRRLADRVITLRDGRVVSDGAHAPTESVLSSMPADTPIRRAS